MREKMLLRKYCQALLPRDDLPGARQPTPFNLNRYVLLFWYSFIGCLTAVVFFGWPALAGLIFHNNGFAALCPRDPLTGEYLQDLRKTGKPYICDVQDAAVQKLYPLAGALCCIMSACGGALLDLVGPRWTVCFGQSLTLIGWLLLAFGETSAAPYVAGISLIGLGADAGFLPCMSITRLFPGASGLIITCLGSASSASSAVPAVLMHLIETYNLTLRSVAFGYIVVGPAFAILVAVLLVPRNNFLIGRDSPFQNTVYAAQCAREKTDKVSSGTSAEATAPAAYSLEIAVAGDRDNLFRREKNAVLSPTADTELPMTSLSYEDTRDSGSVVESANLRQHLESCSKRNSVEGELQSAAATATAASAMLAEEVWQHQQQRRPSVAGVSSADKSSRTHAAVDGGRSYRSNTSSVEEDNLVYMDTAAVSVGDVCCGEHRRKKRKLFRLKLTKDQRRYGELLLSLPYVLIVVYYVGVSWAGAFFQQAPRRMFSSRVVSSLEVLQPFGFIPCLILGKLADIVGILPVMTLVNTTGVLMYAFSLGKGDAWGYLSVVSFVVYVSLFTSQVFIYIEKTFPAEFFGRLIGMTVVTGGLLSFACNPLYEHVVVGLHGGDPRVMQIALICLLLVQYLWVFCLFIYNGKCPSSYRGTAMPEAQPCMSAEKVVFRQHEYQK